LLGVTLGSYRVVSAIGKGGMGEVYRAEHTLLGRAVAIKILLPEMSRDRQLVERFFNEARAAAKLRHPGVVEVFDYGHDSYGNAFIVMELLSGEPLADRIARDKRLSIALAAAIARQVAGALQAAHVQGIVHRDLKPENIFLVEDPDAPGGVRVKVLDFGIAKLAIEESPRSVKTKTGVIFGTPRYMAPEQCKNAGAVDARSDVYALGCIFFEMVLGRAPFDYDSWGELVAAHIHETPPRPRDIDPELDEDVEAIVLKAIAKRPEDRYASMAELSRALEDLWRSAISSPRSMMFTPPAGIEVAAPRDPTPAEMSPTLFAAEMTVPRIPRRKPWLVVAALGIAAAAVGAYFAFGGDSDTVAQPTTHAVQVAKPVTAATPPANPPTVDPPPTKPAPVVEPTVVRLEIESVPTGADVYRASDGVKLGKTPLTRDYERTDGELDLVVRKSGYRDARIALSTKRDGTATAKLVALPSGHPRPPVSDKTPKPPPTNTGPTVLEPWSDH
jgi:tRNA A-37 threonylcarbamoyl transferase component Bud32